MRDFRSVPIVFILTLAIFLLSTANFSHAWYPLNDTGIQFCGEADSGNNDPCTGGEPQGQDAHYGRDALAMAGTLPKAGAGAAGFDFTKVSNSGNDLPIDARLGYGPDDWACTRDNVTGILWEVKVGSTTHLRSMYHTYSWYDTTSPDGNPGSQGDVTSCNDTLDGLKCNTEKFVAAVNSGTLCGNSNWRLPEISELESIIHFGNSTFSVDQLFFPNIGFATWSGTPSPYQGNNHSWLLYNNLSYISEIGQITSFRTMKYNVVLVSFDGQNDHRNTEKHCENNLHPANKSSIYVIHDNGTVIDTRTELTWKLCSEGQFWNGETCVGNAVTYSWSEALNVAQSSEFAGYSDWRLPNVKELRSLAEECRIEPSINTTVFPNTPHHPMWTGSPDSRNPQGSWFVNFTNGTTSTSMSRNHFLRLRLVRGGQNTGSLRVVLEPPEVLPFRAGWRIKGTDNWEQSAVTLDSVPTGSHLVEFRSVPGWIAPENVQVVVVQGETTELAASYRPRIVHEIRVTAIPEQGGIVHGADFYDHGALATISAQANEEWLFFHWSESEEVISVHHVYPFDVLRERALSATFIQPQPGQFLVAVAPSPEQGGRVEGGNRVYVSGDDIAVLSAFANIGWEFSGWLENGEVVDTDAEIRFHVVDHRYLTAAFVEVQPIPTLSEWGLVLLAGLMLVLGAITIRRLRVDSSRMA